MANEKVTRAKVPYIIWSGVYTGYNPLQDALRQAKLEGKREAYEEAAQKAERQECSATLPPEGYADGYLNACAEIANAIRTLKNPLVQETSTARRPPHTPCTSSK